MATITISYYGEDFVMSDKGHTKAKPKEPILWSPGEGVHSVTKITAKPDSPVSTEDFWSDAPHETGVNFKGTISNLKEGTWKYDIKCNIGTQNDPVYKSEDPRIQVYSD